MCSKTTLGVQPDQTLQINNKILGLWMPCIWGKFDNKEVSTTRQNTDKEWDARYVKLLCMYKPVYSVYQQ